VIDFIGENVGFIPNYGHLSSNDQKRLKMARENFHSNENVLQADSLVIGTVADNKNSS
jgi:Oxysterol-binding protein